MNALLLFSLLCALTAVHGAPIELFVDGTNGKDTNAGTLSAPFATVGRARDAVRAIAPSKRPEGVHVQIRAGDYISPVPGQPILALSGAADSGVSESGRVVYAAYQNEAVRFLGGPQVPRHAWSTYAGDIMVANLTALGVTRAQMGELLNGQLGDCANSKMELFFDDVPAVLARYPNIDPATQLPQWLNTVKANPSGFTYSGDRVSQWSTEPDVWLHGYFYYGWADNYVKVAKIDPQTHSLTVNASTPPVYGFADNARYYGVNILSELDVAPEYYISRDKGLLYFMPPPNVPASAQAYVSREKAIVTLSDVSYVTLSSIQMMFAQGWGVHGLTDCSYVTVEECVLSNQGQGSVNLHGDHNQVLGNQADNTGCAAIDVGGGDSKTLVKALNLVHGNSVVNFARWKRTYQPGIGFSGVGNTYSMNNIFNGPHTGITGGGNDHIFSQNHFKNLCFEVTDSGAWYSGRSWARRGSLIFNNTFEDVRNTEKTFLGSPSVQAIYFDDQLSQHNVSHNRFINCHVGVFIGGGRRHSVSDNYFSDCGTAVHVDDRGLTWQKDDCQNVTGMFGQELTALHYQSPPYSTHYPALPTIFQDRPCVPYMNHVHDNTYCRSKLSDVSVQQMLSWNSTLVDNTEHCE